VKTYVDHSAVAEVLAKYYWDNLCHAFRMA